MIERIFKKQNKNGFFQAEEYKNLSIPFVEFYYPSSGNIIKNYILAPDKKVIK